jgi:hypothetical protein
MPQNFLSCEREQVLLILGTKGSVLVEKRAADPGALGGGREVDRRALAIELTQRRADALLGIILVPSIAITPTSTIPASAHNPSPPLNSSAMASS